jgi:hypothetical protein
MMSARPIPAHMSFATELPSGAVAAACSWNVIHRNAPGAISAMAFIVTPVSPSVGLTPAVPPPVCSWAMRPPFAGQAREQLPYHARPLARHRFARSRAS